MWSMRREFGSLLYTDGPSSVPQCCLLLNWSWKNRTTPCLYVCGHRGGASQPAGCFIYSWQHNNNPCMYCLCYLVFFCTCHLNKGFQIIFWQLGLWKKVANGLLLCNSLLAKLNFEVNYEPQLPSQCTYLKEGYNLRTLERLLQWRTPHWLGLLGPSFFEVVCTPPLGACAMCGLVVHYFAGILMDCLCKSQTYKLLSLDFYTWNSKFQIEEPQSWFGPDISCLALKLPKIDRYIDR